MRVSVNWLKDYVDIRTSPQLLAEKLTMAGLEVTSLTSVDGDTILEIEVTPNRADCLSILGIAREIAAISGKKLNPPRILSLRGAAHLAAPIQIQAQKQCLRYLGRVIKNVKVGPSPEWLIKRLEVVGVRAVNNIVDITNFCLWELGQPLHAFDLDKLKGQKIIVRLAAKGEEIVTIDGVRRQLGPEMLVIADKASPQAIAGIMGAKDSEVTEATTNILLESAYFEPLGIHHTSRKLGLATQSSYRFERGVDLAGVRPASLRATALIKKLAWLKRQKSKAVLIGRLMDKGVKKSKPNRVRLRYAKAQKLLGEDIAPAQIKEILSALGFVLVRKSAQALVLEVPSFRPDVSREVDLVEEAARLYGYDKIPLSLAQLAPNLSYAARPTLASDETYSLVRQFLSSLGLNEIMSYSLLSRQALKKLELPLDNTITITNPLSYEQEVLRPTLLAGMLNALLININRKNTNLKLFELSRVYRKEEEKLTKELTCLCIGLAGRPSDNWLKKQDQFNFFDLKGIVQALLDRLGVEDIRFAATESILFTSGRAAAIMRQEENLGFLGEVKTEILERFELSHPVYAAELEVHKILRHIRPEKKFVPLARFPSVDRDISLIVSDEIHSEQIVSLINKIGRELVAKVTLFDQYTGEQIPAGFRGLSYSIEYRSAERTLTAEETDALHKEIRQALTEQLRAQIR